MRISSITNFYNKYIKNGNLGFSDEDKGIYSFNNEYPSTAISPTKNTANYQNQLYQAPNDRLERTNQRRRIDLSPKNPNYKYYFPNNAFDIYLYR